MSGAIKLEIDRIPSKIDQLADLCAIWSGRRSEHADCELIRAAILSSIECMPPPSRFIINEEKEKEVEEILRASAVSGMISRKDMVAAFEKENGHTEGRTEKDLNKEILISLDLMTCATDKNSGGPESCDNPLGDGRSISDTTKTYLSRVNINILEKLASGGRKLDLHDIGRALEIFCFNLTERGVRLARIIAKNNGITSRSDIQGMSSSTNILRQLADPTKMPSVYAAAAAMYLLCETASLENIISARSVAQKAIDASPI